MAVVLASAGGVEDRSLGDEDRCFRLSVDTILAGREAFMAKKQIRKLER